MTVRYELSVERDVVVRTADGVDLATDVYHPVGDGPFPTLMQRTCYGKELVGEWLGGRWFAERGYRVVFQDCRGSGGSTGEPDFFAEAGDGRATGDWVVEQPWFDGHFATFGSSYMGFTQWAFASTGPPYLGAMAVGLVSADRRTTWYPGGSFALDIALPWSRARVHGVTDLVDPAASAAALEAGFDHLPLRDADVVAVGREVPWYRDWLEHHEPGDPFWERLDFSRLLPELEVPVLLFDGWYDYPLPHLIRDFHALARAGVPRRLVIGPWSHAGTDQETVNLETLAWFDRHLLGHEGAPDDRVRIFVMPDVGWRDLDRWPPPNEGERWWLQPDGGLATELPPASTPSTFEYDPADPTPSAGGISLRPDHAGPVDNRALEARDDVLTFTSGPLPDDHDVIGAVVAELFLSSSVEHFDVFVRLCDVDPEGRSTNVCDAIRRLLPGDPARSPDGTLPVSVELWPTAYRFGAGHRLRLQVSGGAHPLFARNTCSGEPLATAATLVVAEHAVYHDPSRPSSLVLSRPV
jgi:uncharacterized protein